MTESRVYSRPEVAKFFANVDWDFADAWTRHGMNVIHWYPTKLPPQIASALIRGLRTTGDVVCDPFCGSGTVLSEAMRLGRRSISVDVSPLACLISRAKTTLIPLATLSTRACDLLQKVTYAVHTMNRTILPLPTSTVEAEAVDILKRRPDVIFDNEFIKWFHPEVVRDLAFLTKCLEDEKHDATYRLLKTAVSALLRTPK